MSSTLQPIYFAVFLDCLQIPSVVQQKSNIDYAFSCSHRCEEFITVADTGNNGNFNEAA
jgi:hypothetical protein